MSGIHIHTTQNVDIEFEKAGLGDRILAYIIDTLLVIGYFLIVILLLIWASRNHIIDWENNNKMIWMIVIAVLLPYATYRFLFEAFMNGQTPGKRVLKIKVVKVNGTPLTIGSCLLRWLFNLIDFQLFYGLPAIISISVSQNGQRIGDLVAGTTVIKMKNRVELADTVFERIKENYTPTYPQVTRLASKDIEVIKQVLNNSNYRNNPEIVQKLFAKIKGILDTETHQGPIEFLETVVRDYTYYG